MWSDEARALVRPFKTYEALAREPADDRRKLAAKVLTVLFVLGGFVSLTASGRLVASHVINTMVFWSFAPALQAGVMAVVVKLFAREAKLTRALWLYFVGHGAWMLFLLSLVAVCLFAPNVYRTMMGLLTRGVVPFLMLGTIVWSIVLTLAFFRRGLGLGKGRSALATLVYYVGHIVAVLAYYFATEQLQPQLFGVPE